MPTCLLSLPRSHVGISFALPDAKDVQSLGWAPLIHTPLHEFSSHSDFLEGIVFLLTFIQISQFWECLSLYSLCGKLFISKELDSMSTLPWYLPSITQARSTPQHPRALCEYYHYYSISMVYHNYVLPGLSCILHIYLLIQETFIEFPFCANHWIDTKSPRIKNQSPCAWGLFNLITDIGGKIYVWTPSTVVHTLVSCKLKPSCRLELHKC